jgi:Zn finger protein HypA/HybF involved in hydrogenase expression
MLPVSNQLKKTFEILYYKLSDVEHQQINNAVDGTEEKKIIEELICKFETEQVGVGIPMYVGKSYIFYKSIVCPNCRSKNVAIIYGSNRATADPRTYLVYISN